MCGVSKEQRQAYNNEKKISDSLSEQFQKFAGDNAAILGELTHNLTPIQSAGPSQFGFNPAEEAALRTGTAEQINAAGSQVSNAVRNAMASKGGGSVLPSGSEASIIGALAQDTAVKEALAQSNITAKGYDIGRQNWEFATEGLMRAPGELENPITSAGDAALRGGKAQSEAADKITAASRAWEAPVGKIIGAGLNLIPGVGPILGAGFGAATSKPKSSSGTSSSSDFTTDGGFFSGES